MTTKIVAKLTEKCQYQKCKEKATDIVYDRKKDIVKCYCKNHTHQIVMKDVPQYIENCPNCNCVMGIN